MISRKITFRFKQFDIDDSHCGMKIGTDGVLLGAWTSCDNIKSAIDIGCGCGVISLMLAQRGVARIQAVEVDGSASVDAASNFRSSTWHERFALINDDFQNFRPEEKVDLIVSNPPFFSSGEQAPDFSRARARHEADLNYTSLINFAKKNLASDGLLSFIYPYGNDDEIIYCAEMSHLKLRRICYVRQRPDRPFVRTLYEFSLTDGPIVRQELTISNPTGLYTDEYLTLTKEFYAFKS